MLTHEAYRYSDASKAGQAKWSTLSGVGRESALPDQSNKTAKTINALLRQCSTYQFHDTSANASLHQRWDVSDSAYLRSDGGNLAAVLLNLRETDWARYQQLVRQVQRVFPTLEDFVLTPEYGKVLLRWKSKHSDKVFIATQSPYMVDCFDLENIIIAQALDGATMLQNLSKDQYQQWLDDDYLLSDIWLRMPVGVAL